MTVIEAPLQRVYFPIGIRGDGGKHACKLFRLIFYKNNISVLQIIGHIALNHPTDRIERVFIFHDQVFFECFVVERGMQIYAGQNLGIVDLLTGCNAGHGLGVIQSLPYEVTTAKIEIGFTEIDLSSELTLRP